MTQVARCFSAISLVVGFMLVDAAWVSSQELKPLKESSANDSSDLIDLGRTLFFDGRLSGDATTSCATCHDPSLAYTDGLPLSKGYPGTEYFRNTPTLLNASKQSHFYWDGRMSGDDLPSLVRDHIAEAHFMQADGRLVIERLRQIPFYETTFQKVSGGKPSYGKILNALAAFVRSLTSSNVPFDRYLNGQKDALSKSAVRGLELFTGKANCIQCHHGELLTDEKFHRLGTPANASVFSDPMRHITFRRFMRTIGVGECATLRHDIGLRCVTKEESDNGKFRTPSLREVANTAPYMHDGSLETLEDVVAFYNVGGDDTSGMSTPLKPLGLDKQEQSDLVVFLKHLSGDSVEIPIPELPKYELRPLGQF